MYGLLRRMSALAPRIFLCTHVFDHTFYVDWGFDTFKCTWEFDICIGIVVREYQVIQFTLYTR